MIQKSSENKQKLPSLTTNQAAALLLMTILDTTWRAFVPPIAGTVIGVMIDNATGSAPLYTSIMIALGFATSILLVFLQLRKIRKS
jgi:F0F1-type ATP synthase assembly protein I